MTSLVSEVVLGVKESNIKTRVAAYDLLVDLAHEMQAIEQDTPDANGMGWCGVCGMMVWCMIGWCMVCTATTPTRVLVWYNMP